jgi:hypothetical protein
LKIAALGAGSRRRTAYRGGQATVLASGPNSGCLPFALDHRKPLNVERAKRSETVAEREGFEPSVRLPVHMISSHAPSATRSPLQVNLISARHVYTEAHPACLPLPRAARRASTALGKTAARSAASWGNPNRTASESRRDSTGPGGESGIRTHGTLAGTPDFESGTFGHSVISPRRNVAGTTGTVNASAGGLGRVCDVGPPA